MPNYISKLNLDGSERTIKDPNAIRFNETQSLTDAQKAQARANIAVPTKVSELTNDSGYTNNTGTITGIKMNGASKGTSGIVDLGTVLTSDEKMFRTDDAAETAIADNDYFPFYDASASSKRKSLWSNIVNVLKNTFAIKNHASSATTYGVGTTSNYGHNKLINTLYGGSSFSNGDALSAHMGNVLAKLISGVETGTKYSRSYKRGEYFIWNDQLYTVVGVDNTTTSDTITPGTNCMLVSNLANEVSVALSSAEETLTPVTTYVTMESWSRCFRRGGFVTCVFKGTSKKTIPAWTAFANIGSNEFRPILSLNFYEAAVTGSSTRYQMQIITSDGALRCGSQISSGVTFGFTVSYPCKYRFDVY